MITLVTSRIRGITPDIALLQGFEQYCARNSTWQTRQGPVLFAPRTLSSRVYTFMHATLKPVLRRHKVRGAVLSLGMPYHIYLYSKTFPYFAYDCDLRVLWTYDVWEPDYSKIERLVRQSGTNLLLLSSYQSTEHFRKLRIPGCEVHWVPESINTDDYHFKPWHERKIQLLSFGRSYMTYHNKIEEGCRQSGIEYACQERNEHHDVAVHGLKQNLQFPTWESFTEGLANAQICLCFPRALTHPQLAGNVSTLTIRYLQAMASKCLLLGTAPLDTRYLFDYNPVVEVNWNDPLGQVKSILSDPLPYQELIEKNYAAVCNLFHHRQACTRIEQLITERLGRT